MAVKTVSNEEKTATKISKPRTPRTPRPKVAKVAKGQTPTYPEILFEAPPCGFLAPEPPYLWIDYPQPNEVLHADEYVIRLGVAGEQKVQLSFNDGGWVDCRYACGFWWYDWAPIARGDYSIVARMQTAAGVWYRTPVRSCHYPA